MSESSPAIEVSLAGALGAFSLDVAFEAPARGVTALFGPSGCGKTTVLRCLAGLTRLPGRVVMGNNVWQDCTSGRFVPAHRRELGYVFQEANLFPHLSVRDNLLYGARRAKIGAAEVARELASITELLGLTPLIERSSPTLSGGERQRVAVGRALLSRPRVLLMDEPLSALDRMTKDDILPYFERLAEELHLPIVYVSHDIAEVARLARRVVVMRQGRVQSIGPVADVLSDTGLVSPEGLGLAGALVESRIVEHHSDGLTELGFSGGRLLVPRIEGPVGAAVRVRIAAQEVMLATERPHAISALNVLSGTITEIRMGAGPGALVRLRCGDASLLARITQRSAATLGLAEGQACFAVIKSVAIAKSDIGSALQSSH